MVGFVWIGIIRRPIGLPLWRFSPGRIPRQAKLLKIVPFTFCLTAPAFTFLGSLMLRGHTIQF